MRILQFAFELEEDNPDYPHNYPQHCIAYTGTHDNDTARGWLTHAPIAAKKRALSYMHAKPSTFHQDMVRTVWASPAMLAIAPMHGFLPWYRSAHEFSRNHERLVALAHEQGRSKPSARPADTKAFRNLFQNGRLGLKKQRQRSVRRLNDRHSAFRWRYCRLYTR